MDGGSTVPGLGPTQVKRHVDHEPEKERLAFLRRWPQLVDRLERQLGVPSVAGDDLLEGQRVPAFDQAPLPRMPAPVENLRDVDDGPGGHQLHEERMLRRDPAGLGGKAGVTG